MKTLGRLSRALILGALAGLATLGIDETLAFLFSGHWLIPAPWVVAVHLIAGASIALVIETGARILNRRRIPAHYLVSFVLGLLYSASVFERVFDVLESRLPFLLALAGASFALLGVGIWVFLAKRVIGRAIPDTEDHQVSKARGETDLSQAWIVTALCIAAVLAVNRHALVSALSPAALLADVGILSLGLTTVAAIRLQGAVRVAIAGSLAVLLSLVLVAAPWSIESAPREVAPTRSPHLILIVIDTLRLDVFEAVLEETPEGRLFRTAFGNAAHFSNAVSTAPWTAPSVASIMTGLYPPEHGFGDVTTLEGSSRSTRRLSDSVTTLAQHLEKAGYQNAGIVANGVLHPETGIQRGFRHFELLTGPQTRLPLLTVLTKVGILEPDAYESAKTMKLVLGRELEDFAKQEQPLFLWLHLMDPHYPLRSHDDLEPISYPERLTSLEQLYFDEVRFSLREIAGMIGILSDHGYWENAVVALVADHGEMFPRDGHLPSYHPVPRGHGHALFGELVKVPLMIRPPGGLPAERGVDVLTSHVDLIGTFFDLLGIEPMSPLAPGRFSLAPWLASTRPPLDTPRRRSTLIGFTRNGPIQRAVRTETLKLIQFPDGELPEKLFDLSSDPLERRDLGPQKDDRIPELRELLELTWSQLELSSEETAPVEYDAETLERLKSLGYL